MRARSNSFHAPVTPPHPTRVCQVWIDADACRSRRLRRSWRRRRACGCASPTALPPGTRACTGLRARGSRRRRVRSRWASSAQPWRPPLATQGIISGRSSPRRSKRSPHRRRHRSHSWRAACGSTCRRATGRATPEWSPSMADSVPQPSIRWASNFRSARAASGEERRRHSLPREDATPPGPFALLTSLCPAAGLAAHLRRAPLLFPQAFTTQRCRRRSRQASGLQERHSWPRHSTRAVPAAPCAAIGAAAASSPHRAPAPRALGTLCTSKRETRTSRSL